LLDFYRCTCYTCYCGVILSNTPKTKDNTSMENELVILADKLTSLHGELGTWERVGKHYGLPKITLWRIVFDEYEPKNNEDRRRLGLSEIIISKRRRNSKGRFAKDIG